MLAPLLTAAGYRVTTASSARDALFLMSKGATFHAIVTDTDMPEMDGYTLARAIRRDPRNAGLPIIALAAHVAPIIEEAAKASGMCGVVGKFDRAALLAMLRRPTSTRTRSARTSSRNASSGRTPHEPATDERLPDDLVPGRRRRAAAPAPPTRVASP